VSRLNPLKHYEISRINASCRKRGSDRSRVPSGSSAYSEVIPSTTKAGPGQIICLGFLS